ncbi:MAG: hypothetical protein WB791_04195 [Waddliaceae bacterium]
MVAQVDQKIIFTGFRSEYEHFPHEISLNKKVPLTNSSFKENIEKAMGVQVPCYLLAVAQVLDEEKDKENFRRFYVYDSCEFQSRIKDDLSKDPFTQLPIEKVYYFVVRCFYRFNNVEPVEANLSDDILAHHVTLPADGEVRKQFFLSVNYTELFNSLFGDDAADKPFSRLLQTINKIRYAQHYMPFEDQSRWLYSQQEVFGTDDQIKEIWDRCCDTLLTDLTSLTESDDSDYSDD